MIDRSEFDVLRPRHSIVELVNLIAQFRGLELQHDQLRQSADPIISKYKKLRDRFNRYTYEELREELRMRQRFISEVVPYITDPLLRKIAEENTLDVIGELTDMVYLKGVIAELPDLDELVMMPDIIDQIISHAPPE